MHYIGGRIPVLANSQMPAAPLSATAKLIWECCFFISRLIWMSFAENAVGLAHMTGEYTYTAYHLP